MKRVSLFFLFVLTALLCVVQTFGQGTDLGTIRGVVTDSAGAVIPGAAVTITNYEVFGLNPGTYTVAITAAGMSQMEIKDVRLHGSDVVSADAQLKVSEGKQSVTVSSEAVSIDTDDQTISETISGTAITELPRDSRDVYSFLYLNPNITQGSAAGEFKFLGAQSYGASFSLDGQRSNGGIFGEPTLSKPSLEAVGDVNILTSDFSAEYAGIANIRVNTKRGGSEYHGSIFYNNKNSALAAWTLDDLNGKANFAPTAFRNKYPNPYFNENDLGASFGGPVPLLKKTWFFAAYERDYNVAPVKFQSSTVAHPDLYTGDFTQISDASKPLVPDATLAQMTTAPATAAANSSKSPPACSIRPHRHSSTPTSRKSAPAYPSPPTPAGSPAAFKQFSPAALFWTPASSASIMTSPKEITSTACTTLPHKPAPPTPS